MPGQNRHRTPTAEQLFRRVYRQQLETRKAIKELKTQVEQLASRTEIAAVLADHVTRLLLEKKTLLQIVEADQFMATALRLRAR